MWGTKALHLQASVVLEVPLFLIPSSVLVECCYLEEPEYTKLYIVMSLHWSDLLHGLIYLGNSVIVEVK